MTASNLIKNETDKINLSFQVDQEHYQGPLETIIHLLRKRKLHVSDVNLARIADEFSAFVSKNENSLPELSDFVRVMSVLLLIKTKALLPKETLGLDDEETIAQFEADLSRIELLQELIAGFDTHPKLMARSEKQKEVPKGFMPDKQLTLSALVVIAQQLSQEVQREETFAKVAVTKLASLKTTIERLERRFLSLGQTDLANVIPNDMPTNSKVVHFIAILELLKQNRLSLRKIDGKEVLQYGQIDTPSYGFNNTETE